MPTLLLALLAASAPALQDAFVETRRMLPDAAGAKVVLAGDVDGDGWADAVTLGDGVGFVLRNLGWALFADAPAPLPELGDDTWAGVLADLDGDGDLDLFRGNEASPSRVLENQGGAYTSALELDTGDQPVLGVAAGDVDGDGDGDLVTAAQDMHGLRLFRNAGGLNLVHDPGATGSPTGGNGVALADLDGDGDLDLWLLDRFLGAEESIVRWNDGAGGFGAGYALPSMGGATISFADVDADGDLDAYRSTWLHADADGMALNDGAGGFTHAALPVNLASHDHVFDDVDGDGLVDVVALFPDGAVALRGIGLGQLADVTASWIPVTAPPSGSEVAAADLDGDGDLDLVLDGGPRLVLNDGGLLMQHHHALPWSLPELDLAVGDVDGDGDADVLTGTTLALQRDGLLWEDARAQLAPTAIPEFAQVGLFDLDGDGDLDAALGALAPLAIEIQLNDGSGNFSALPGAVPPGVSEFAWGLAAGDVDGDGDADLAIAVGAPFASAARVLANDGTARFTPLATPFPGPAVVAFRKPVPVDVELDGDLDLVYPGGLFDLPFQSRLFLGDGAGGFVDATTAQLVSVTAADVTSGDVDGDGFPELAFATPAGVTLARNDGSGGFTCDASFPASGTAAETVAFADVDGNGDVDVLATDQDRLLTFLGDGAGAFALQTSAKTGTAYALAALDLDADGDVEVLTTNGQMFVHVRGGQVAWRSVPRVGKPLRMEVFGDAGTPWFLAASTGQAQLALPPLGSLLLDPAHLLVLGAGVLPAAGAASLDVPVPASASLLGQALFWQGVTGAPPAFTNRETTILTGF